MEDRFDVRLPLAVMREGVAEGAGTHYNLKRPASRRRDNFESCDSCPL
jgi:hypothetical protein